MLELLEQLVTQVALPEIDVSKNQFEDATHFHDFHIPWYLGLTWQMWRKHVH